MPRPLTSAEIERFASRQDVRRIAVENFLGSLPPDVPKYGTLLNLRMDARLYRWSPATVSAIMAGIDLAYGRSAR
jgi:hypothetical protein